MDEKITQLLEKLAGKLGTTVENLYNVLVRQAKLDALISLISLIVCILLVIPDYYAWQWLVPQCVPRNPASQYAYDQDWPSGVQIMVAMLVVISVIVAIAILFNLFDLINKGITALFNPEASALEKILSKLK